MEKCYPNLENEIKELGPSIIFLLGKQVAGFVLTKLGIKSFELDENFNYRAFKVNAILYIPIHHPSFVLVYKRKYMGKYAKKIQKIVEKQLKVVS